MFSEMFSEMFSKEKILNYLSEIYKSFIFNIIISYIILHSANYFSNMIHSYYCSNYSIYGYFSTMITSHGPICHTLLSISYYSELNIYQLIPASFISNFISKVQKKV